MDGRGGNDCFVVAVPPSIAERGNTTGMDIWPPDLLSASRIADESKDTAKPTDKLAVSAFTNESLSSGDEA